MSKKPPKSKAYEWASWSSEEDLLRIAEALKITREHGLHLEGDAKKQLISTMKYYFWEERRNALNEEKGTRSKEYTVSEVRKMFESLENWCEGTLETSQAIGPRELRLLRKSADYSYEDVKFLRKALQKVKKAARIARASLEDKKSKRSQQPINDVIRGLIRAYEDSGKKPGLSRSTNGIPGGPLFRFVRDVCAALGYTFKTDEAAFSRIKRLMND